jgi:hypothetical protein
MQGKKLFSICLAVLLMITTVVPAYAQAEESQKVASSTTVDEKKVKITKEEARQIGLKALKDYFETEIDDKKFESRFELRPDYEANNSYIWEINWSMYNGSVNMQLGASINANTGKIMALRKYEYPSGPQKPQVAKFTYEQAKKISENFITKINPDALKNAQLMEDPYAPYYGGSIPQDYNFRYTRLVNGIQYETNNINLSVSSVTGKVTSFYSRWDETLNLPSSSGTIDKDKALEIFKKEITMKLSYMAYRDPRNYEEIPQFIRLVYNPSMATGYMIDAKTGNMTSPSSVNLTTKDLSEKEKEELYKNYKEIKKLDKEIEKDKAEEIMTQIIKDILGSSYTIESVLYQQNSNYWDARGKTAWTAQIRSTNTDNFAGGQIIIDASTGQLISLYRHNMYNGTPENFEPKITWEEAYTKSINAIAKYFPDKVKDILTEQIKSENYYYVNGVKSTAPSYYFTFQRSFNGVGYSDNSITVEIDTKTGTVSRVSGMWDDNLMFPDTKNVMSSNEASAIFFENNDVTLSYVMINKSKDVSKPEMEPKLVYMLKSKQSPYPYMYGNIDAKTGKIVDYRGEELNNKNSFSEKIKDNPYEKELNILAFQGIIDSKTFDANKQITKMDMITMLVNARGYRPYMLREVQDLRFTDIKKDDENYKYIQMAVRYGIIKNEAVAFKADQKITRETLAQMLINSTPYAKLAESKGIFTLNYSDTKSISPDKYGYIAIAKGLSIMDGTQNVFNPKAYVTMTELAITLYNTLPHMSEIYY